MLYIMWGYFKDNPSEEIEKGLLYIKNRYNIIPEYICLNPKYKEFKSKYRIEVNQYVMDKVIFFKVGKDDVDKVKSERIIK